MNNKILNKIITGIGIATIITGSFTAYCLTGVANGYTIAKPQEYYDSLYREGITKNYQIAGKKNFEIQEFFNTNSKD